MLPFHDTVGLRVMRQRCPMPFPMLMWSLFTLWSPILPSIKRISLWPTSKAMPPLVQLDFAPESNPNSCKVMIHLPDAYWIPTCTWQVSTLLQNACSVLEKYFFLAYPAMTVFTPRFSPYSPREILCTDTQYTFPLYLSIYILDVMPGWQQKEKGGSVGISVLLKLHETILRSFRLGQSCVGLPLS